jgi:hypothetical protein
LNGGLMSAAPVRSPWVKCPTSAFGYAAENADGTEREPGF